MTSGVLQALGGLGVFLFGMTVMTGALRSLADERLREILARTVDGPIKGVLTGAFLTAALQSSSATTVAAVGFVGAGLMTFPQSLGVIFGANVGTTVTGWIVALIGLKLDLGQAMMPLILVGALLGLTRRRVVAESGRAIVGFGLIFVGIGTLQAGLAGLQGWITPDDFPSDTVGGRLILVLAGVVVTIITQSSSAGVATALAAVHAGTISLNQAAAIVIGMDVGTTATAALATLGGNVQARRTGFAHVIYNTLTGVLALLLLTPFMGAVDLVFPTARTADPELVLVGFHTFFNAAGVMAVLPFTNRFADLVIRLIPERGNPLTRQLDRSLVGDTVGALAAVRNTLWGVLAIVRGELLHRLENPSAIPDEAILDEVDEALSRSTEFLGASARLGGDHSVQDYVSLLHVIDHLGRLQSRLREAKRLSRCRDDEDLASMSDELAGQLRVFDDEALPMPAERVAEIRAANRRLKTAMRAYRVQVLTGTAESTLTTATATSRMDTARTLRRAGYHLWRIAHYFGPTESIEDLPSGPLAP